MKIRKLRICGFRGFNEECELDLSDPLVVFSGPNGTGKTSIGEAIEWLLYGKTLKRTKGDDLSKREYSGCYRNVHFDKGGKPFVEAEVEDLASATRKIRRELRADESSELSVDGKTSHGLTHFGIDALYDRPLILQHTLQDFIFMKPKGRYSVLSSMLGLEALVAFRKELEKAKTEFAAGKPMSVREAEARRISAIQGLRLEPIFDSVVKKIESRHLVEARGLLRVIASVLVSFEGDDEGKLVDALEEDRTRKERNLLDWGAYSAAVLTDTANIEGIKGLDALLERMTNLDAAFATLVTRATAPSPRETSIEHQDFFRLGLRLLKDEHTTTCPFCVQETLTPKRVAELAEAVGNHKGAQEETDACKVALGALATSFSSHYPKVAKILPRVPSLAETNRIRELVPDGTAAFVESGELLSARISTWQDARGRLEQALGALRQALLSGTAKEDATAADLRQIVQEYVAAVRDLPASINGYAAHYLSLDPTMRSTLASSADVQRLARTIQAFRSWGDIEVSSEYDSIADDIQQLIRETRAFIEEKQKSILAGRDEEIRGWYGLLNPASDVAYDGITTGTDSLELKAVTYAKQMMAAPNLSTSQLNCVGLAVYLACSTRAGSPFRTLVIDDPVQSMDDEHTEAFKKQVLGKLMNGGYHVILLTHMKPLADDVESLYRKQGAVLYRMKAYSRSGPTLDLKRPELTRLLDSVRTNKDAQNDDYRKVANQDLRKFVEIFTKEFFTHDTGESVSKKYEDKSWSELRKLLRRCKNFNADDEPRLEDTHSFTSRHLHTGPMAVQDVPSSAQLTAHYSDMKNLLEGYSLVLGLK